MKFESKREGWGSVRGLEGLKDRPQEVKETLLLPRKHLFASERHLLPSGNANRL
jgi:hypothetical protein